MIFSLSLATRCIIYNITLKKFLKNDIMTVKKTTLPICATRDMSLQSFLIKRKGIKTMKKKIYSFVCIACLLLGLSAALISCNNKISKSDGNGIAEAEINKKGELVLVYKDGSEQNLGVVVGKDGKDGKDGANGANGADGADGEKGEAGANGANGANGTNASVIIQSEGTTIPEASAKGLRSAVSIACKFKANSMWGGIQEYSSEGSGVIYKLDKANGDAFIITNYHVVYDSSNNTANGISEDIKVYIYGSEIEEKAIQASYVGGSLYYDIAVLRIEDSEVLKASSVCAVETSDSDKVMIGDSAIAIGNARGYGIATSFGIVSVDSEYITMLAANGRTKVSFRVIRVDTAVNSGNSGGGLYDETGKLIGIVNAKIVDDGVENIGYAIPSNIAVSIAENIIDYCYGTEKERVQRANIGVFLDTFDSMAVYDSTTGKLLINEKVAIDEIEGGSLAEGVLQVGDVLVSAKINEKVVEITRQYHIIDMMIDVRVGDVVTLNILRDGEEKNISFAITEECLTEY